VFQEAVYQSLFLSRLDRRALLIGDGKTHLSLMSGDRRNAPGRVNEMLAERVLLLCFSAVQKPESAPSLYQPFRESFIFTTQPPR
jgi:hypothetical protein